MRTEYFGDSYDIVKKFLLHSLAPKNAKWVSFPMFTDDIEKEKRLALASFIKAIIP